MPTPRPRLGRGGVYNPKKYTEYKKSLIAYINTLDLKADNYDYIHARFFIPFPKATPKKKRINNSPLKSVFDCDNVVKGLCDALEQSNILSDDRVLWSMFIEKFRTTDESGRIEFDLEIV